MKLCQWNGSLWGAYILFVFFEFGGQSYLVCTLKGFSLPLLSLFFTSKISVKDIYTCCSEEWWQSGHCAGRVPWEAQGSGLWCGGAHSEGDKMLLCPDRLEMCTWKGKVVLSVEALGFKMALAILLDNKGWRMMEHPGCRLLGLYHLFLITEATRLSGIRMKD